MPNLNLEFDYPSNPKTKKLIRMLGPVAIGLPLKLWGHAGKHHMEDGRLVGYSVQDIEDVLDWSGEPGAAVKALVEARKIPGGQGFLEEIPADQGGGYAVHDWQEHAGHLIKYHHAAKAGAAARWKNKLPYSNADRIPDKQSGSDADRIPERKASSVQASSGKKSTPPTPRGGSRRAAGYPADFELFWFNYPHKVGKGGAARAFARAKKRSGESASDFILMIQKAVTLQKRSAQWVKDDGQFIPHPSTWLNQNRWEDQLKPVGGQTRNVPSGPPPKPKKRTCAAPSCRKSSFETYCSGTCRMAVVG